MKTESDGMERVLAATNEQERWRTADITDPRH